VIWRWFFESEEAMPESEAKPVVRDHRTSVTVRDHRGVLLCATTATSEVLWS
jgi:hypothetical protein